MNVREEVKIMLGSKCMTITELAKKMTEISGKNYSQSLISHKIANESLRYTEMKLICKILGYRIYIDIDMAVNVVVDAKTQYPSACNAVETLLIHKDFAKKDELLASLQLNEIELVENPDDWSCEYGDKILSVKTVNSVDEAIEHINTYGSGHTDCIITEEKINAEKFMNEVDSSGVYHNVSTRFADGFRYGFGAEVGISTNKTHARGPVGLEGLTIYKYRLSGKGQIVDDYAKGLKSFHHKDLI